jgi:hypothetical protein
VYVRREKPDWRRFPPGGATVRKGGDGMEILNEVASASPWRILGWLLVAFIAGALGWVGLEILRDWWRNSRFRRAGS